MLSQAGVSIHFYVLVVEERSYEKRSQKVRLLEAPSTPPSGFECVAVAIRDDSEGNAEDVSTEGVPMELSNSAPLGVSNAQFHQKTFSDLPPEPFGGYTERASQITSRKRIALWSV